MANRKAAPAAAAARCICSMPRPASTAATPSSAAACRFAVGLALGGQDARPLPRDLLRLRRRRGGGGRIPRSAEPRRAVAAAGAVPLREQSLRDGHRHPQRALDARSREEGRPLTTSPSATADGMDVLAVEEAAARRARPHPQRAGPSCSNAAPIDSARIRCSTRNYTARKTEVEEWKKRDPIPALFARMKAARLAHR